MLSCVLQHPNAKHFPTVKESYDFFTMQYDDEPDLPSPLKKEKSKTVAAADKEDGAASDADKVSKASDQELPIAVSSLLIYQVFCNAHIEP